MVLTNLFLKQNFDQTEERSQCEIAMLSILDGNLVCHSLAVVNIIFRQDKDISIHGLPMEILSLDYAENISG